jgi:ABC-type amino acid transport substrate-binding protein
VLLLTMLASGEGRTQEARPLLEVGTKEAAPFVMRDGNGEWTGISIFLWEEIARALDIEYELRDVALDSLFSGVESGRLDAAFAALTITAERERRLDFTHPYYSTGLAIAARAQDSGSVLGALRRLVSADFMKAVGALTLLLLLIGLVVWLLERRANPDEFGGSAMQGIGSGFWWSAVTMTTVGYGDKAPRSVGGRILGLVWMFAAIIMISGFTASITSSLTVSQLGSVIRSPADLARVRVGALGGSTSAAYLQREGIAFTSLSEAEDGVARIEAGTLDAFVHDEPVLRHMLRTTPLENVALLPFSFEPQSYGIALPPGSTLREPINRALLEITRGEAWRAMLDRYLGE